MIIVFRHWKPLLIIPITLGIIAGVAFPLWVPSNFEATSVAVIVRTKLNRTIDSRLQFIEKEETADRSKSFLALAKSPGVASDAFARLRQQGLEPAPTYEALTDLVRARIDADAVSFTASHKDASTAAAIANAWLDAFTGRMNAAYGGELQGYGEFFKAQTGPAEETYRKAQKDMSDFVLTRRTRQLSLELEILKDQAQDHVTLQRKLQHLLRDAKGIRTQLRDEESGATSDAAADNLAWLALKTSALTASSNAARELRLEVTSLNLASPIFSNRLKKGEVDLFIGEVERRLKEVTMLLAGDNTLQKIRQLESSLESENAREKELTEARNGSWESYLLITRKVREESLPAQDSVTRAIRAVLPTEVSRIRRSTVMFLAGVLGIVGTFAVIFMIETRVRP